MNALRCGYIRIIQVIHKPQAGHFAFNRLDAGSPADQIHNLVAVQLPAHQCLKRNDFTAGLIRPPGSAAYDTAQC